MKVSLIVKLFISSLVLPAIIIVAMTLYSSNLDEDKSRQLPTDPVEELQVIIYTNGGMVRSYFSEMQLVGTNEYIVFLIESGITLSEFNNRLINDFAWEVSKAGYISTGFAIIYECTYLGETIKTPLSGCFVIPNCGIKLAILWSVLDHKICLEHVDGIDKKYTVISYGQIIMDALRNLTPNKEGYEFLGWLINGRKLTHYDIMTDEPVDLRPIFKLKEDTPCTGVIEYNTNLRFQRIGETYKLVGQLQWRFESTMIIPTFHNGRKVTHIANSALDNRNINYLVLPFYVEVIGEHAFDGLRMSNFSISNLPNLHTIGKNAFSNSHMTTLVMENLPSLTTISSNAFINSRLLNLYLTNLESLEIIGQSTFANGNLRNITMINLPSLQLIDTNAFLNNHLINNVIKYNVNANVDIRSII